MRKHILFVPDMSCEHCVKVITEGLGRVEPPLSFEVVLETKQVIIETEDFSLVARAEEVLREEGYTPERVM